MTESVERATELRHKLDPLRSKAWLEVDGGMNVETAARMRAAVPMPLSLPARSSSTRMGIAAGIHALPLGYRRWLSQGIKNRGLWPRPRPSCPKGATAADFAVGLQNNGAHSVFLTILPFSSSVTFWRFGLKARLVARCETSDCAQTCCLAAITALRHPGIFLAPFESTAFYHNSVVAFKAN